MRDLLDLINTMSDETSVELHDSFDIELSENFVIETGVVALTEDAIVIEGDDKTCELLEEHGLVLEKMIMGLPGDQGSKTMGEDGVTEESDDEVDEYALASGFISQLHTDPYEQSEDWVYNQIGEYLNQQGIPEQYWQKIADLIFRKLQGFAESKQSVAEGSDNLTFQEQRGKWYCFRKTLNASPIGVGDTPEEAEDNYRKKTDPDYGGPEERARILDVLRNADRQYLESPGGNWYIRVNGKILNDTKFKPVLFSSQDEARIHAIKLANKKHIPLSQIKLTRSWMDAPEQGVAEDSKQDAHRMALEKLKKALKNPSVPADKKKEIAKQIEYQRSKLKQGVVEGEMDDGESYDENQPIEFYIALHDLDDNSLFIGAVSKYNGNWHESTVKGNPPYNWGSNYMSYLTPSDVWQHIRNDFRRGYELGGPFDTPDEAQEYADSHFAHSFEKNDDELNEAEYHGRKVSLGKPFLTPDGPKKRSVYVRKPNGKVVKVNFGDKKMRIKKSSPAHRKSFRARHNCANPGPRWKARYWSCRAW